MERYFVKFKNKQRKTGGMEEELLKGSGCKIKHNYDILPDVMSVEVPEQSLDALERNPQIESIKPVNRCGGEAFRNWGWGYDYVESERYYYNDYRGSGIKIGIIDTGISSHSNLPAPTGFIDYVNNQSSYYDDHGHGSFVAGIIAGNGSYPALARSCSLYVAKVWDSDNRGFEDDMTAGVDWLRSQGVDIINISGSVDEDDATMLIDACRVAYSSGIVVVGISGNGVQNNFQGRSKVNNPAKDYSVVAVGAIDSSGNRTSFSNYGSGLNVMAPGSNIVSCNNTGSYWSWEGTSFSAPFVTSHLASLKNKYPSYSRHQLVQKLYQQLRSTNNSWEYGNGILRAEATRATFHSATSTTATIRIRYLSNPTTQYAGFRARRIGSSTWQYFSAVGTDFFDGVNNVNRYNYYTSPNLEVTDLPSGTSNSIEFSAQYGTTWYNLGFIVVTTSDPSPRPQNWSWYSSELNAFDNKGSFATLTWSRWNDFLTRVDDFCVYKNTSKLPSYVYRSSTNKILYASHFRLVSEKIHDMSDSVASECRTVNSGNDVMGWYFINLSNAITNI